MQRVWDVIQRTLITAASICVMACGWTASQVRAAETTGLTAGDVFDDDSVT